jgi:hypothetical protein
MANSFEQAGTQLARMAAQQQSVAAAVAAGELWMEAGVAECAAARCDQVIEEINDLLANAKQLTWKRKFGDNEDGNAAAARFAQAGHGYINTMLDAQNVFRNMAATYRAAGRTSAVADVAAGRMGGLARGASAVAAERAGLGGLILPIGAAGGKSGEDSEHRRPSYLIEIDDIFTDGRKVAPAVIGEDPPGHGGSS